MIDANELRRILADSFGIKNDDELTKAIKKMPKLNIGVFSAPKRGCFEHEPKRKTIPAT